MYKRVTQGWMKHIDFMLIDLLCLHLSFLLAHLIRHGVGVSLYETELYRNIAIVMTFVDILVMISFNTMHDVLKRGYYDEFAKSFKHELIVLGLLSIYLVSVQKADIFSRIVLYVTSAFHFVIGYGTRLLWKVYLRHRGLRGKARSLLIVVPEASAEEAVGNIQAAKNEAYQIVGLVLSDRNMGCGSGGANDVVCDSVESLEHTDDATRANDIGVCSTASPDAEMIAGFPVVSTMEGAGEYICRNWVDEVLIIESHSLERPSVFIEQCQEMGVVIHESLSLEVNENAKQFIEKIDGYSVLTTTLNYATPLQSMLKRMIDIVGGIIGCLIMLVVVAIVGPKIKKASPGSIFFKQTRVGKNGRLFTFVKLRSMYMDAEERKKELMEKNRVKDGMMFKLDFDPRIIGNEVLPDGSHKTGIGDFIRKTSLDEFPQFWNVLKGDMSLVGTRPPTIDEWEKYMLHHRARMAMKPGITGMWQISGRSNITDFEDVVKLDTEYIREWSMGLDCRILVKTVREMGKMDGAM